MIDGKFPEYDKVMPKDNRVDAKANVDEFVSALDRLKSLSSDRKGVIKVSLNDGIMKFLINDAISGNLCRCTGYSPIIKAIKSVSDRKTKLKKVEIIDKENISIVISGNRPIPKKYVDYPDFIYFDYQSLYPIENEKIWNKILSCCRIKI